MTKIRIALALVAALLGQTGALAQHAATRQGAPFAMMRTLQVLQEQIAQGNVAAQSAQPKLMAHIAKVFLAVEPDAWHDPRNARAAALFLLSGGKPSVIRAILTKTTMPADIDTLLKGALAYGEGQDDVARALLGTIDPRTLPTTLGGHLALVEATLLSDKDNPKAEKLLDLARLLVPGTLVEEAALRRQIFLLADTNTLDKFASLSRQYIRRFRNSVYAENFKQRFIAAATSLAVRGDAAQLAKLDAVLAGFPIIERRAAYLEIAKAAVLAGKSAAAAMAAEKAAALAKDQSPDSVRAKLYAGAALVVTDRVKEAATMLEATDRSRLSAEDAGLRDAALSVATLVRADAAPGRSGDTSDSPGASAPSDDPSVTLTNEARKAMADSEGFVTGSAR